MAKNTNADAANFQLVPMPEDPNEVPGRYASIDVSPEPIYGPDQLGPYKAAIETLTQSATRTDSSARIFEILKVWEARLFSLGYQFLTTGNRGIGLYGGSGTATPTSIMATGNAMKLFPVNVYGARQDKITAAGSREVPGLKFSPKDPDSPPDQTAADAADNYLKVWLQDSDIKGLMGRIWRFFYTDGTVVLWTRSVADQQRWGTETPDEQQETFGAPEADGVTPETELKQPFTQDDGSEVLPPAQGETEDAPAICELTTAHGVLERKVPIYADEIHEMGYLRLALEQDVDILRERYPWIADKIEAGTSSAASSDQYDRMARINVRLAVQTSTASGETFLKDATEMHTWYRPSQYRMLAKGNGGDKAVMQAFFQNFPKGLRVTHAGGELAFVRNEGMDEHLTILHCKDGDGQARRAIGTNYLPLQKVLNQTIGLVRKYFTACVPRRFADVEALDVEAINQQANDPSIITGVKLGPGQTIPGVTGIENVPQPTTGLMEFVQWLVDGAPEAMDGATPTMFGAGDAGTVGEATLNRDQSLQVYSAPWRAVCIGLARSATQAAKAAAANRKASIRSRTPGQGRLTVELSNLQGDALCAATSMEIPQTLAEQEAQTAELVEQSANVDLYKAIVSDPQNLTYFAQMPSLKGLNIPGLDAVEKQQGEFELLMQGGPLPNPLLAQLQEQIEQITASAKKMQQLIAAAETEPEAQTPAGQQALTQLQTQLTAAQQQLTALTQQYQQLAQTTPLVSSVTVAQDGSENHAVEAAIVLAKLNSPEGRKFKNGDQEQMAIFANLKLHWQEHEAMVAKLTPVQPLPVKATATVAIDKLPPNVQAQALQAMGVAAKPEDFQPASTMVPHETTVEKEGVDENGAKIKTKTSTVNPAGQLS